MPSSANYGNAARSYTDGVRTLFSPPGVPAVERGPGGPSSPEVLADQGEALAGYSQVLTQAAEGELHAPDWETRAQTSDQLLAKALTDLHVGAYFLEAAQNEEANFAWPESTADRGGRSRTAVEDLLKIIDGQSQTYAAERRAGRPNTIEAARSSLDECVGQTLLSILQRAAKTGQNALAGLLGIGLSDLGAALGAFGMDVAAALGQAQRVSRLYQLVRSFVIRAFDSLLALLGKVVAQSALNQATQWLADQGMKKLDELKEGKLFGELLDKYYQTGTTRAYCRERAEKSPAALDRFGDAIQGVGDLDHRFADQIWLAEKLVNGLRFIGGLTAVVLPPGKVVLAAAYFLLGSYVVLAGANYVDSPGWRPLNLVEGVRRQVDSRI